MNNYKLYRVTMNHGGWYSYLPTEDFVATSPEDAVAQASVKYPWRVEQKWVFSVTEIVFEGYEFNILKVGEL